MIEDIAELAALISGKIDGLEARLGKRLDAIEAALGTVETRVEGAEFSAECARVSSARAADLGVDIVTRLERIENTPAVAAALRVVGGGRG